MTKKNVLIFPAGTEIAFEILNALKYSKFVNLFGGTSHPCHVEFVFRNWIDEIPFPEEDSFLEKINEAIDRYHIDWVYPSSDAAQLRLTRDLTSVHAGVVTSPLFTVETCRSKKRTYKYLAGEPYLPRFYSSADDVDIFPIFIKPSVGQASVGAQRIDSRRELDEALSDGVEYLLSEYLPGEEYTVDCFTDRNRSLLAANLRNRERIRNGIAVRSRSLPSDPQVTEIAESLNSHFEFNGAWFFQVKKNIAGEYRLMEVSPRIPGTMGVSRNRGINFPLLTLHQSWGDVVSVIDNGFPVLLDRAFISRYRTEIDYQVIYVDFDDTLFCEGVVNTQLIRFLYQAVNQGKKLVLMTKHRGSLDEALTAARISKGLFDRIIHLPLDGNKADYISDLNGIFIDDSFGERKSVHEQCGIPVFDLDMVESLIDWRV